MQRVAAAAALVALAVLRLLGSGERQAVVPSDGQFDCCVCGGSGATLLRLQPMDLVALCMRRRLSGDRQSSPAVASVIIPT